jgi:hypothetical protein
MNKEQVLGIVRHGLTFVGAILLLNGEVDQFQWSELTGAVLSLASVIWSIWDKRNTQA